MSQRKAYVIKRERELVIRSTIIEDSEYRNLKDVLLKYERIDDDIIEKDSAFTPATVHILKSTFPAIVQNAVLEWEYIRNKPEKSKCTLDNRPIDTKYFIKNVYNGNEIFVGSECIRRFDFKNGVSSLPTKSMLNKQQQAQRRISRRNRITETFGNVDSLINEHLRKLDTSPVVLPSDIYREYGDRIKAIQRFSDDYINSRISGDMLPGLASLLSAVKEYCTDTVDAWIQTNLNVPFIATLNDAEYLKQSNQLEVLNEIRENRGIISVNTVCCLGYVDFIVKHLQTLRNRLSHLFSTIRLSNGTLYVNFVVEPILRIRYTISSKDFIQVFGKVLFGQIADCKISEIYPKCKFVNNVDNIWELIGALQQAYGSAYEFLYSEDKYQVYILKGKTFCDRLDITALVEKLLPYIISERNIEYVNNLYFNRLSWFPESTFSESRKELRRTRKNMIGI